MNMQPIGTGAPQSPRSLDAVGLPPVMMRDIALKTIFRMNARLVSEIAAALRLPVNVTQDLVDLLRGVLEALDVFAQLRESVPDLQLLIAYGMSSRHSLEEIKELSRIMQDDLHKLIVESLEESGFVW